MNVTTHDFTKPIRLSAVWDDTITTWARVALGLANKAWAKQISIPLEATFDLMECVYAAPALAMLPEPAAAYRVLITPNRVPTMLVMPRISMLKLVGALLGESGEAKESATGDRELTLIEENLAEYFLTEFWLAYFRESWPTDVPATWILDERETNPQCSRTFTPEEVLIALRWTIVGPWGPYSGVWLFPKNGLLQSLGDKTTAEPMSLPESNSAAKRESVVQTLPLLLQVVLGTTELKLSQLSSLQVGDVLLLDKSGRDGTIARVGTRNLFRGQAGRNGSWKAFQVKAVVEK